MYVTFCKFWIVDVTYLVTQQLNWSHTQFVCAWIGHVDSVYVINIKEAIITVTISYLPKVNIWLTGNYNLPFIISLHFLYIDYYMQKMWTPYSCSNFVIYFAVFSYYMHWLIYSGSHLHILVSFYPSLLCLYAFCIFPL